ncbi:MAG: AI-2E family transporter [Deltaproteobacteria bacterium]|nr:AI-2E family transporter [Deltaproteobacteria bacterium]MBK8239796.1 AI-2E family transporter [Deltaproteobacteria bacterium]
MARFGTGVLLVATLYFAREVLMPLAFGMVLAFLLAPVVRGFERVRFPRGLAVALTMAASIGLVGGFAWVLARQLGDLAAESASYASSIHDKIEHLRHHEGGTLDKIEQTVASVSAELDDSVAEVETAPPVRVVPDRMSSLSRMREVIQPLLAPVASSLLVLVLVSFMLAKREDVRDRVIRLMGPRRVALTTRLIDEVFVGVSRYLLAQTLINALVGSLVALGMWALGVPYAPLWGTLTFVLRFVPYVGSMVALALPALLAFATSPGWVTTLGTVAVFLGLDIVFAYFVEPVVIGQRVGVSSLALLVSVAFWTWIWGPLGLAIATPLTACIVVLGRHLPRLEFLGILLGDTPALTPAVRYYQRLLSHEPEAARAIVVEIRAERGDLYTMDAVLMPAMSSAFAAQERGELGDDDAAFVVSTTKAMLAEIGA